MMIGTFIVSELDEDLKKQILEGSPEKMLRQRSQTSESSNSLSRFVQSLTHSDVEPRYFVTK